MMSDISSIIGLVTKARELADHLKNLELKGVIVDLQGKVLDLKEEIVNLREENADLKRQIKEAPVAATGPKETPTLKNGLYYKGDDGPFCTACHDSGGTWVRPVEPSVPETRMFGFRLKCPACKTGYT
jgi:hypothetical protein